MMNKKSLKFNLIIKTEPETDDIIQIADFDTDFDITKTNKSANNKAVITIWNLDDTNYQNLVEKDQKICIYTGYGEEEPVLVFRGNINKVYKKNAFKSADAAVYMELIDGKQSYTNAYINKNYRGRVTSTVIIKDCIKAMNLDIRTFNDNLPERTYENYKAVGLAHTILQKICTTLNLKFSVQNEIAHIASVQDEPVEETAVELNIQNAKRPTRLGTNEMLITTGFIPQINPNSTVKCNFTEFSGLCLVNRVHSFGNNYGKAIITEIVV